MQLKHLKPRDAGAIVRDPQTHEPLPPDGREVELTTYWRRRIMFGDVVIVPDAKLKAAKLEPRQTPAKAREA